MSRGFPAPQSGLRSVLADLRRADLFAGARLPRFVSLPVAPYRSASGGGSCGARLADKKQGLRTFRYGPRVRRNDPAGQVFDRVESDDLHWGGASGDRLGVEPGTKAIGGFRFLLDVRALG